MLGAYGIDADQCINDTLIVFNPLSNPRQTVLGTGQNQQYFGSVSGGSQTLQYSLSAQSSTERGLLKMSDADVAYLERTTGKSVPGWQRRPQTSNSVGATSRITMQVMPSLTVDVTSAITQNDRQSTPLADAISLYEGTGVTPADTSLVTGRGGDFRTRLTNTERSVQNSLNATWVPRPWWNAHGDAGYQTLARSTRALLRRGDCVEAAVTPRCSIGGRVALDQNLPSVTTLNLVSSLQLPSEFGLRLRPALGVNYVRSAQDQSGYSASGLALGSTNASGAQNAQVNPDVQSTLVQFGLFAETGIALFNERVSTTIGTRIDASNALGKSVRPTYPKLDLSYVLSNESFFPRDIINLLRLRVAYGHAGVQPALGAGERSYRSIFSAVGETGQTLVTVGNPGLRPERSTELEGGFDLGVFGDRVTMTVTGYRKRSRDALISTLLPGSLGLGQYYVNIGSVSNTGGEFTANALVIDGPGLTWNVQGTLSRNSNRLVKLDPQAEIALSFTNYAPGVGGIGSRYVEGYPLSGTWVRPIVSFADINGDGVISNSEFLLSDTTAFVGGPLPRYESSFGTQVGVLNGRLTFATQFQYQNGMSVVNQALLAQLQQSNSNTLQVFNDRSVSLAEQAWVRSGAAAVRTVSVLRLQSLSLRATVPSSIVRRLRAGAMTVALQGNNLGLWTTYSGADPNVTSIYGNTSAEGGILPTPRSWGLNVSLNY